MLLQIRAFNINLSGMDVQVTLASGTVKLSYYGRHITLLDSL